MKSFNAWPNVWALIVLTLAGCSQIRDFLGNLNVDQDSGGRTTLSPNPACRNQVITLSTQAARQKTGTATFKLTRVDGEVILTREFPSNSTYSATFSAPTATGSYPWATKYADGEVSSGLEVKDCP